MIVCNSIVSKVPDAKHKIWVIPMAFSPFLLKAAPIDPMYTPGDISLGLLSCLTLANSCLRRRKLSTFSE